MDDKRRGSRNVKILDTHKQFFVEKIEENPRITLFELASALNSSYGVTVSTQCVRMHLDALVYTLKSMRHEPEVANSAIKNQKSKTYVENLIGYQR